MKVFVIDTNKKPLGPVDPGKARLLLTSGEAAVFRRFPFTIILKRADTQEQDPLRVKIDPGSKVTGLAVVNDATGEIVFAAELEHRGRIIKALMDARRLVRKARRTRKTRYRASRCLNRVSGRELPPSLESRVANVVTWVNRLRRYCPVTAISQELVRFDMQLMENAEISGVQYQQGELVGYEIREYLLEKFDRKCVYCQIENVPLQMEHIFPKSRGGTGRISNLVIACGPCNQKKGNQTAAEFGYPEIQAQAKKPLKDAAAVNTTRWFLYHRLVALGLDVEVGSGGLTKFNRSRQRIQKSHWGDAACVGPSTPILKKINEIRPIHIKAMGHGKRRRCRINKYGFPVAHMRIAKSSYGYQTGDLVRAVVTAGKYVGTYIGRIVVRFIPSFQVSGVWANAKYFTLQQRNDGYDYSSPKESRDAHQQ